MKIKYFKSSIAAAALLCAFALPTGANSAESAEQKLNAIADEFGPVLQLSGTPAVREINAIANLITPGSGMMTIDLKKTSGELCMLEAGTKNNMIHFSPEPENTKEDILYFISPDEFKSKGLRVTDLAPLPTELNKMTPLKWYYYDGKAHEPHHGKRLHRDFLVMAIDVK
ncbi:MAG: hypothetical protein IME99_07420 [Proteobacteria bacterium]|nr:hypothetical protein [Pseudomonadota bacterium]